MINRNTSSVIIILVILLSIQVTAADWPHWRGPFLNGSSNEKNLPEKWTTSGNVAWVSDLPGPGAATAVIANGKVFVSSTDKNSNELIALCFDARNGNQIWRKKLGASNREVPRNNPACPSPVTDGNNVYFMFGSGDLAALDFEGNILWSRNIEQEYGNISQKFGYSSSPLLNNNKLYILVQRRHTAYRNPKSSTLDSFILAVDAKTGNNIWKQPRNTDALNETLDSYSSPILFQQSEHTEILVMGADYFTANDEITGTELWRYEYSKNKSRRDRNVSSPVVGKGFVFGVPSRGSKGLLALNPNGEGVLTDKNIAWKFDGPSPDVSSPLLYKGNIYILCDRASGTLTCLDAKTGKQKWQGELGGNAPWWASVTAADDKLYCINEAAQAVVLAAGEQFKILARIDMEDKPVQASIAIAEGHLFIRTANKLFCIGNQSN